MTYDDILEKIENGAYDCHLPYPKRYNYPDGYIFDENQSIIWNRQMVEKANKRLKEQRKNYNLKSQELINEFENDCAEFIQIETKMSKEKAQRIFRYVFSRFDSNEKKGILDEIEALVIILK